MRKEIQLWTHCSKKVKVLVLREKDKRAKKTTGILFRTWVRIFRRIGTQRMDLQPDLTVHCTHLLTSHYVSSMVDRNNAGRKMNKSLHREQVNARLPVQMAGKNQIFIRR